MTILESLQLKVTAVRDEALDVRSYELRAESDAALPTFTAGAHIDLHLANGLVRSYSLCNPPQERNRYVVAVQKDAASRGGSNFLHAELRAGQAVHCGAPRNNFPLAEDAAHTIMIAGGIGVTPFRSMVSRLDELGRSWELYYCARTRGHAAFVDELAAHNDPGRARVHFNFDQEPGGRMLDLGAVIGQAAPGAHLYCCGPLPMLSAFEHATAALPPARVHLEYFSAKEQAPRDGGFEVELARSGRVLQIQAGQSILDAVLEIGVEVPHACAEGVCGSCETTVLAGTPDHRDLVLSAQEQAAGKKMMICCSGAKEGARLVLDL